MKKQFFVLALLGFSLLILAEQNARGQSGQYTSAYSTIDYDAATNIVTSYSYTYSSYGGQGYYQTYLYSALYDPDGTQLTSNFTGGTSYTAELNLQAAGTGCGEYRVFSDHRALLSYYVNSYYYEGSFVSGYYDAYNYYSYSGQIQYPYPNAFSFMATTPVRILSSSYLILGSTEKTSFGNCDPMEVKPAINNISPNKGVVGQTTRITITGSRFRPGLTLDVGFNINATIVSRTSTQVVADLAIAANATGGNRSIKVISQGTSNPMNFFVQIPTSLKVLSKGAYTGNNYLRNGCPESMPFGFQISVRYQVLDQNSTPVEIKAAVPIKENLVNRMTNGQSSAPDQLNTSVVAGDMTESDGTFTDKPIGACASGMFSSSSFTQELFTPISNNVSPTVKTNNWVFTGMNGCGNMTNGNDISVSVKCQ